MNNKQGVKRVTIMTAGIILMGFGISLAKAVALGTDPFTCMNLGVSRAVGMSFGSWQLIVNTALIILIFLYDKKYIGIATVVNMIGVGYIADFFTYLWGDLFAGELSLYVRFILLAFAVLIAGASCAMYLSSDLGTSPYDCVAFILTGILKGRMSFRVARILSDVTCVAIGFAFGSIVGVGTVAMAVLTGPLVQFFSKIIKENLFSATEL